ncbi:MAG: hypothetical protein HYT62_02865 [Candidatus Yanofskybacteria bacterium]|nr:hypothetical protein [Candidatus Yanofskybacteria bacterium]
MGKLTEQIPTEPQERELDIDTQESGIENLDFWMLQFLKEHIDMPEDVDFAPEAELETIKKAVAELPEEEQSIQRRLLMDDFRKRLKTFRKNMAQAQVDLEKALRENPDAELDELESMATKIVSKNSVLSQARYFNQAVESYFQAHKDIVSTVEDYRARYPNDWETKLFIDLFGQPPHDKIEIEIMPINMYIKTHNLGDYAAVMGGSEERARMSVGVALNQKFPRVVQLSGNKVLVENTSLRPSHTYSEETIKPHEEEHSIHKNIYPRSVFVKSERNWLKGLMIGQEIGPVLFDKVIRDSITTILLTRWLYGAKTEILAYMKQGKEIDGIKNLLTESPGLYSYIDEKETDQNWFLNNLTRTRIKIQDSAGHNLTNEEIKSAYADALNNAWHKRYLPMLEKIFQCLKTMLSKYSPDKYPEIMRLLAQEPINRWPRLAKILS